MLNNSNKKVISIAHIVQDDKFIDDVKHQFELDNRFRNEFYLVVKSPHYSFHYIKDTHDICILSSKRAIKELFSRGDIDCFYFYSLPNYRLFKYISKDKIVIWWAWGWDIYGEDRFINIPLYKPLTKQYLKKTSSSLSKLKCFLKKMPFVLDIRAGGNRKKVIKRIDYFQPVIHMEFQLMQRFKGFKAHEFYNPGAGRLALDYKEKNVISHKNHILLGHSATFSNNHLDVWNAINAFIPSGTSVFFPVNYGKMDYADYLGQVIQSDKITIRFIKDFLPKDEYFELLASCGYAIFGVLREQAMANIYHCLLNGVKLFLYKNSIPFKYLTDLGCVVYAIEDINVSSFRTLMSAEQVIHNRQCLLRESKRVVEIREEAIKEIQSRLY